MNRFSHVWTRVQRFTESGRPIPWDGVWKCALCGGTCAGHVGKIPPSLRVGGFCHGERKAR